MNGATTSKIRLVGGVPVEVFDARRFPHDWREAGFDDSGWGAAQVVPAVHIGGFAQTQPPTDPYGPLYPRPIASWAARSDTRDCAGRPVGW